MPELLQGLRLRYGLNGTHSKIKRLRPSTIEQAIEKVTALGTRQFDFIQTSANSDCAGRQILYRKVARVRGIRVVYCNMWSATANYGYSGGEDA